MCYVVCVLVVGLVVDLGVGWVIRVIELNKIAKVRISRKVT